ncbi:MAG: hypothetical protein ACHP7N_15480 [Caulobacterales bacterium]
MRGAAVLAITVLAPLAARAGPTAPVIAPAAVTYAVLMPVAHVTPQLPHGWSLAVTMQGQTMALRTRGRAWANDPYARTGDVEAGFGWRRGSSSVVMGFAQRDYGADWGAPPAFDQNRTIGLSPADDPGVLGLSLSRRTR